MDDQLFAYLQDDIREMKSDIKTLLAFKWQILGGSAVISVLVSIVFQIILSKLN